MNYFDIHQVMAYASEYIDAEKAIIAAAVAAVAGVIIFIRRHTGRKAGSAEKAA